MLLATYVPKDIYSNNGFYNELKDYLGYYPIPCFPAENARETIWRSILADPEIPEQFIVFETEEFTKLDIVQWNQRVAKIRHNEIDKKTEISSIESCFTDENDIFQVYLVKNIDNVIASIDIKDSMSLVPNTENSEWKSFLADTIRAAQGCAVAICKNVRPGIAPETSWSEYNHVDHMIIKEGFQGCMLPLFYPIVLNKKISYSTYFDYAKYLREEITNKIARFFDPDGTIENKSYKVYLAILRDIRSCLMRTYDVQLSAGFNGWAPEFGPNSMCPCGSGKKYKKCCKTNVFDQI